MERRHIIFIILVVLILGTHFALRAWLAPPQPPGAVAQKEEDKDQKEAKDADKEPKKDDQQAAAKAKGDDAKAPADGKPPQANVKDPGAVGPKPPEAAAAQPAAKVAHKLVTIGSIDRSSGYRMLVWLDNLGGAVQRVELGGDSRRQYFDTDDKTGYLGHLALTIANEGCLVNAVGHGTPAFLAKETGGKVSGGLAIGDVIAAFNGQSVPDPEELDKLLQKTRPGEQAELAVIRPLNGKTTNLTFAAKLTRHPLELIRPETHTPGGPLDPFSFLLTLDKVGARELHRGEREIAGISLYDSPWEVTKRSEDSVEFTYRVDAATLQAIGQEGPLRIVKRYTLARQAPGNVGVDRPYSLRLQVEIHNDGTATTPLAYRLSGPNGLPLEGWWYLTKLHPQMFHAAGARDVVWRQPQSGQQLLGCRAIYDGALAAKNNKDTYEQTLLSSNKPEPMEYVGVDTQFFAATIVPQPIGDKPILFRKAFAEAAHDVSQLKKEYARTTNVSVALVNEPVKVEPSGVLAHDYEIFLGPKDPAVLAQYNLGYLIEKGWPIFRYPTDFLSWVLHLLYAVTRNYGIAIVLLTVIVRACMLPLSIKQAKNAAKMQELAPEIKRIREKYANDTEKQMKAQSELYKKHNFNMFGGCLPVFIQLPIFIGLYRCLSVDIALRDAPLIPGFWWASNLAGPDKLFYWKDWLPAILGDETGYLGPYFNVLPVITCALFILQQNMFMPPATDEQTQMQQSMMKYMTIFMGIMFFKVPTGLCIYFIVSTSWSIVERTFLPKHKPAAGGSTPEAKSAAAGPSPNGSPGEKRGPKLKSK